MIRTQNFIIKIIIELIIFMKMSDSQYQTFGCVYQVQETTQQVYHPRDSQKDMKSKAFNMNSSFDSYQDHLNSSSMFYKTVGTHDKLNSSDAVTSHTQKGSIRGIKTWGLIGLSKDRDMENERSINRQKNLGEKTGLKKLTEKDEFLCSCVQQNKSDGKCIACRGKKYADGNSNMVKFIEYIMQFKQGKRGVYQNERMVKKGYQCPSDKKQEGKQKGTKMLCFDNVNMRNNQILQKKGIKQPKQKISLINKNRVTHSETLRDQRNFNISNEHCRQFYMQQNKQEIHKPANAYGENPIPREQENQETMNQALSFKQSGFNADKTRMRNNTVNGTSNNQATFSEINKVSQNKKLSLTRVQKMDGNRKSMYNIPANSSSAMFQSNSITENPRQSIKSAKICKNITQLKQKMCKQPMVHLNFSCDNCNVQPIIGVRYHCNSVMCWNDFDLCEKCYKEVGHDHSMVAKGHSGEEICKKIQKICLNIKNIGKKVNLERVSLNYEKQKECLDSPSMIFKSSIH